MNAAHNDNVTTALRSAAVASYVHSPTDEFMDNSCDSIYTGKAVIASISQFRSVSINDLPIRENWKFNIDAYKAKSLFVSAKCFIVKRFKALRSSKNKSILGH